MSEPFLDSRSLLFGSWQGFERDVARLLIVNGFTDVRVVGGSGDKGADVIGVKNAQTWLVQCKFTANGYPPASAVDEVAEAGRFYGADRLFVACSRMAGPSVSAAIHRWKALGVVIELLEPATLLRLARQSPEYSRSRRVLREYQHDAVIALVDALRETGRGQIVLATGLGKTVVMAEAVGQLYRDDALPNGRTLVVAGTRELVDQLQRSFWEQLPKWLKTQRLMGGEYPKVWDGITFATVQSVISRLDELPKFDLILIDEAHHVGSETFHKLFARLSESMIGGATATPWRGDGVDIDTLLGPALVRIGIAEGLRRGFLCEADYRLFADDIDWAFVQRHSAHNYSIKQLNRVLLMPTRDEEAAKHIRTLFDSERRRSLIVFCSTIVHARSFAGMLRLFGFRAESLTGDLDPRERDRIMSEFRRGHLDAVTTRDLFNEGVDVPDVDMIAFMRVTHSRRIFVQQLGRGLRLSKGKTKVVVVDFVSDLRRLVEVINLEKSVRGGIERLRMPGVIQFREAGAGSFLLDWMKDQADLFSREGDAMLELPEFDFPDPYEEVAE